MRRTLAWLVVGACLVLASIYFAEHPSESAPQVHEQPQEESRPQIKAATPEDPGPIATVVIPFNELTQKKQKRTMPASQSATNSAADHVVVSSQHPAENFLHRQLRVNRYLEVGFVVPEYVKKPRLRGHVQSWVQTGGQSNRQVAALDLLLLNENEWAEFVHGEHGTTSNSSGPSASQSIDWILPPTSRQPRKYYLVFRNLAREGVVVVDADFSLDLE